MEGLLSSAQGNGLTNRQLGKRGMDTIYWDDDNDKPAMKKAATDILGEVKEGFSKRNDGASVKGSMLYVDEDRQYVSSKDAHDKNGNVMNNITLLTGHEGSLLKGTTITS